MYLFEKMVLFLGSYLPFKIKYIVSVLYLNIVKMYIWNIFSANIQPCRKWGLQNLIMMQRNYLTLIMNHFIMNHLILNHLIHLFLNNLILNNLIHLILNNLILIHLILNHLILNHLIHLILNYLIRLILNHLNNLNSLTAFLPYICIIEKPIFGFIIT